MQGIPNKRDWQRWRDMLSDIFGLQLPMLRVAVPQGRWQNAWQQWEWYINQTSDVIYQVDTEQAQARTYVRQDNLFIRQDTLLHYGQIRRAFPLWQIDVRNEGPDIMVQSRNGQPTYWDLDMELDIPDMPLKIIVATNFDRKQRGHSNTVSARCPMKTYFSLYTRWNTQVSTLSQMDHQRAEKELQRGS
jgi:hypothetical protein